MAPRSLGQPKALTADIINAALEAITETVQKKESISIVGFGTLEVKERKARKGYNTCRTQEEDGRLPASVPAVLQARQQAEGSSRT